MKTPSVRFADTSPVGTGEGGDFETGSATNVVASTKRAIG